MGNVVTAPIVIQARGSELSQSYVSARIEDFKLARKLYKEHRQVEYSQTDHWVKIGGIVINGINRKDMKMIIDEIDNGIEIVFEEEE